MNPCLAPVFYVFHETFVAFRDAVAAVAHRLELAIRFLHLVFLETAVLDGDLKFLLADTRAFFEFAMSCRLAGQEGSREKKRHGCNRC